MILSIDKAIDDGYEEQSKAASKSNRLDVVVVVVVGNGSTDMSIQFEQYNAVEHTLIVAVKSGTKEDKYPDVRSIFETPTSKGIPKESTSENRLKGPVSVPAVVS